MWDHGRRGKATDRGDGGVVVDIFGGRCRLKGRRTEDIVIRLNAAATAVVVVVVVAVVGGRGSLETCPRGRPEGRRAEGRRRAEGIVIRLHAAATAVVVVVDTATAAAVVVVVVAGVRRQDIDDVRVDRGRAERGGGGPEG